MILGGKNIVLGVSGSIAAFKAVELASRLTQAGAQVHVILTRAAQEFVAALSFRSLTHHAVVTETFDPGSELSVEHVRLAERADVVAVAPATANLLARMAHGLADDMLTMTLLATKAPVVIAPAMNVNMWENPATQRNAQRLQERGVIFVGPVRGRLATGLVGEGRLAELDDVVGTLRWVLGRAGALRHRRVLVTAGPTQEPIDPVRHITNPSSGKMGYAVAEAARDRGAGVVLVTGPTALRDPVGVEVVKVRTAVEMRRAVGDVAQGADAFIATAAVSDYRPASTAEQKIKKGEERLSLELELNPDVLGEVQEGKVRVGFAAESEELIANAQTKLAAKRLDLVAANDITATDAGFAVDTNRVIFVAADGATEELPLMSKAEVAERLIDKVVALLAAKERTAAV